MKACPSCDASFPDEAHFCPEDGHKLLSTGDPYIGKVLFKQFEVRDLCGRGSMGTVYRAWQSSMEREAAIKVLRKDLRRDPAVVKRFHREARAVARLSHPNIITVYLVGDTDDGVPFLAMEYVHGKSLDEVCEEAGPLPVERTVHIARQIAAALSEAHHHGIVHRDLKPENIILTRKKQEDDFVKVLDFGIAKILHASEESQLTKTGAIFGTPYYLAPEQASGDDIDHRSDLYALGVILFRMSTGRLPFESTSGMEVLIQHIKERPPRPRELFPDVSVVLEEVILRALAKSPVHRWQSAEDMAEGLQKVLEDRPASTRAPTLPWPETLQGSEPAPEKADHAPRALPLTKTDLPEVTQRTGQDTIGLASGIMGRRRWLIRLLIALFTVAGGSATGAGIYWLKHRHRPPAALVDTSPPQPPPQPPINVDAQRSTPDASLLAPDLQHLQARPKTKPRPRPKARQRPKVRPKPQPKPQLKPTVPPVGPDPGVSGSDHTEESDHEPESTPPETGDRLYDLLD
jgi:serine/threonine-protein kinase